MVQAMLDQANFSLIQSQSRMEQEHKDMETLSSTFAESIRDQQDQKSFKKKRWSEEMIIVTQRLKQEIC